MDKNAQGLLSQRALDPGTIVPGTISFTEVPGVQMALDPQKETLDAWVSQRKTMDNKKTSENNLGNPYTLFRGFS